VHSVQYTPGFTSVPKPTTTSTDVAAAAPLSELSGADRAPARLYRWIRGSRVPADAIADAGSFVDAAIRQPGERPRWAALAAAKVPSWMAGRGTGLPGGQAPEGVAPKYRKIPGDYHLVRRCEYIG
jgi:hypothetical protein